MKEKIDWLTTSDQKQALVKTFEKYYGDRELNGKVEIQVPKASKVNKEVIKKVVMQRITTKVLTYHLLRQLASNSNFNLAPIGRRHADNCKENQNISRLHLILLEDKRTGMRFAIDAGGTGGFVAKVNNHRIPVENKDFIALQLLTPPSSRLEFGDPQVTIPVEVNSLPKEQEIKACQARLRASVLMAKVESDQHFLNSGFQKTCNKQTSPEERSKYLEDLTTKTIDQFDAGMTRWVAAASNKNAEENVIQVSRALDFAKLPPQKTLHSEFFGRETIILDPQSNRMLDAYTAFKREFEDQKQQNADWQSILKSLSVYMQQLFEGNNSTSFDDLTQEGKKIPMETFLEKKQGVCRHSALLTAFFVGKLINETSAFPKDTSVFHYRSTTLNLRSHSFVICKFFLSQSDTATIAPVPNYCIIDYAQGVFLQFANVEEFKAVQKAYEQLPGVLHELALQLAKDHPQQFADLATVVITEKKEQPLGMEVIETLEKRAEKDKALEKKLADLRCPITQSVMRNPVKTNTGQTYEKEALEEWRKNNNTCPMTRQLITSYGVDVDKKAQIWALAVNGGKGVQPEEICDTDAKAQERLEKETVRIKECVSNKITQMTTPKPQPALEQSFTSGTARQERLELVDTSQQEQSEKKPTWSGHPKARQIQEKLSAIDAALKKLSDHIAEQTNKLGVEDAAVKNLLALESVLHTQYLAYADNPSLNTYRPLKETLKTAPDRFHLEHDITACTLIGNILGFVIGVGILYGIVWGINWAITGSVWIGGTSSSHAVREAETEISKVNREMRGLLNS